MIFQEKNTRDCVKSNSDALKDDRVRMREMCGFVTTLTKNRTTKIEADDSEVIT